MASGKYRPRRPRTASHHPRGALHFRQPKQACGRSRLQRHCHRSRPARRTAAARRGRPQIIQPADGTAQRRSTPGNHGDRQKTAIPRCQHFPGRRTGVANPPRSWPPKVESGGNPQPLSALRFSDLRRAVAGDLPPARRKFARHHQKQPPLPAAVHTSSSVRSINFSSSWSRHWKRG